MLLSIVLKVGCTWINAYMRGDTEIRGSHFILQKVVFNPLTPGTFCKKNSFWTFWWLLGWISAKLPLIRSKMHLQHNSLLFLPPASRFSALWLGHTQKSKFWDSFWMRKWSTSLGFSIFGFFFRLSLFSFSFLFVAVIDLPLGLLACG